MGSQAGSSLKDAHKKGVHSFTHSFAHKSITKQLYEQGTALGVGNIMVSALTLVSALSGSQDSWEDMK